MCISSNPNTVYPCKICYTEIKDTDSEPNGTFANFGFIWKAKIWITLTINIFMDQVTLGYASHVVMKSFYLEY